MFFRWPKVKQPMSPMDSALRRRLGLALRIRLHLVRDEVIGGQDPLHENYSFAPALSSILLIAANVRSLSFCMAIASVV